MQSLIIGGTSGLGLELAKILRDLCDDVIITGRRDPKVVKMEYRHLDLAQGNKLSSVIDDFVSGLPKIDRFFYVAGFFQGGRITDLDDRSINNMLDVGLNASIWLCRELLQNQGRIDQLVAVTSTSQFTPREEEPIYTAVKAGLGMLANSLSLDSRVIKTMVAAPAGMDTPFWIMTGRDTSKDNDPAWVAKKILSELEPDFSYKFIKILRDPPRVEIVETR